MGESNNNITKEDLIKILKNKNPKFTFKEYTNHLDFLNSKHIFYTKQSEVLKIINTLKKESFVKYIVIFGSSVYPSCNQWSDIDLCIICEDGYNYKGKPPMPYKELLDSVDYLDFDDCDDGLLNSIMDEGVIVYEK